jgi:parallel beta-helix repeat protein
MAALTTLLALTSVAPVSAGSGTTTRWVDDDGKAGPTSCAGSRSASKKVQTAIDRSDRNDVVIVCPGTYTEVIGVVGARDGLTVRGASYGTAVIKAPADLIDGALGWAEDVSDVTFQWLTFVFPASGCGAHNELQGLWAGNADGLRVLGNQIRTRGTSTLGECGYEDGIHVTSSVNVRVSSNTVRDFKRYGIRYEDGSRGRIDGNAVHFYHGKSGSDDDGDQGIAINDSYAVVTGNAVRSYPGTNKPHTELGIVIQRGTGVSNVQNNKVWYTKTGIGVIDSTARIASNDVFGVGVQRGIHIVSGTGTRVIGNRVQEYQTGIEVDASGTTLKGNDARGNTDQGCLDETTGGGTAGTANTWSGNVGSPASSPAAICPAS